MKILDLLKSSDYVTFVQGLEARIVCHENGSFEVVGKDENGKYFKQYYMGDSEEDAVDVFCKVCGS